MVAWYDEPWTTTPSVEHGCGSSRRASAINRQHGHHSVVRAVVDIGVHNPPVIFFLAVMPSAGVPCGGSDELGHMIEPPSRGVHAW